MPTAQWALKLDRVGKRTRLWEQVEKALGGVHATAHTRQIAKNISAVAGSAKKEKHVSQQTPQSIRDVIFAPGGLLGQIHENDRLDKEDQNNNKEADHRK